MFDNKQYDEIIEEITNPHKIRNPIIKGIQVRRWDFEFNNNTRTAQCVWIFRDKRYPSFIIKALTGMFGISKNVSQTVSNIYLIW